MSNLNYFVIAKPTKARELAQDFLSEKYEWHDESGLNDNVLDALHALLTGRPVSKLVSPDGLLPPLYVEDHDNGPWVFEVPPDWVKLYAEIEVTPDLAKRLIKKSSSLKRWSEVGGADVAGVERCLISLKALSKEAVKKKSSLLLWTSL